jgi:hypothetical protein
VMDGIIYHSGLSQCAPEANCGCSYI